MNVPRRRLAVAAPVIISAVAHGLLAHRASAVFTIGADWGAYNAVPGGLVGGGNASLSADQPNASWVVAAPQSTRTVGHVTNLKSISIQVSSSSAPGAPSANTFADGEAVVRDDNFFFLSQRPDLEAAAGIMRVTLWCHGGYVSRQDQLASTTTSSTYAEWQASAALDNRLVALTGSSGVDGALTGSAPETTLVGDIPFTFDRGEPTIFSFYASAAVGSVRAADATTGSVANVNLTAVFGGLQFFDAAGAPLVPNRDFLFLHSQFRGGNDEFSWVTPAPEPAAPLLALGTPLIPAATRRRRRRK